MRADHIHEEVFAGEVKKNPKFNLEHAVRQLGSGNDAAVDDAIAGRVTERLDSDFERIFGR